MLTLRSITPSITSLACTRVILALRGSLLHSSVDGPSVYKSGTLRPSCEDYLGGSRRPNRRKLTSVGVFELTTFGNTTVGAEVSSIAGFTGSPSCWPSAQNGYEVNSSFNYGQHFGRVSGYYSPPMPLCGKRYRYPAPVQCRHSVFTQCLTG